MPKKIAENEKHRRCRCSSESNPTQNNSNKIEGAAILGGDVPLFQHFVSHSSLGLSGSLLAVQMQQTSARSIANLAHVGPNKTKINGQLMIKKNAIFVLDRFGRTPAGLSAVKVRKSF
jgi:DNA gyrase inhibitor GyrI